MDLKKKVSRSNSTIQETQLSFARRSIKFVQDKGNRTGKAMGEREKISDVDVSKIEDEDEFFSSSSMSLRSKCSSVKPPEDRLSVPMELFDEV